jgi:periplasmic divalent cation tolerance protein
MTEHELPGGTPLQVQTTVPIEMDAYGLARSLVDRRLAACVQVLGPVSSTYRWQGAVEVAEERLLLAKTTVAALQALVSAIRELHPYEEPEIVAFPIVAGSATYLRWVAEEVAPDA